MAWPSFFAKKYPTREQWATISQRIASGFENAAKEWFDICVTQMRSFIDCYDGPELELNTKFDGQIVLVLKAYQIGSISGFLAGQKYLPKSHAKDFCDLFSAQVCGTELPAVASILDEFMKVVPDMRDFHLGQRIAAHLTQREKPIHEGMLIFFMVHAFFLFNCIAVAFAFDDKETEAKLDKLIDAWNASLPGYFQELARVINKSSVAA